MKKRGSKGTTLVEVILAIVILGFIVGPIYLVFYQGYSSFFKEDGTNRAQEIVRTVLYGDPGISKGIIGDLRTNDNVGIAGIKVYQNGVESASGNTLYIKSDLTYSYSSTEKSLYKNSVKIFDHITNFTVSKDALHGLISITIEAQVDKGKNCKLTSSYKIQSEN